MNNYVNPYFPNRKVRHAKLLVEAGFHIDERWYKFPKTGNPKPTSVSKLIYWLNEKNETITFFDYEQVSLKTFLARYSEVVKYNYKKRISIYFPE